MKLGRTSAAPEQAVHGIDRMVANVQTGRFERSLSAQTAAGALVTAAEIFFEHDSASFGNKMMWLPVALGPVGAVAGVAGSFSQRLAKTALPVASAAIVTNGLQGFYLHARGIGQKPGGWSNARYNLEMGPPLLAPLLVTMVGGMGDRNESAWLLPNDGTRTNHRLRHDIRRFADADVVDLVVVGCGAGGSTLMQRLSRRGWRVAGLDAGPFWDPDTDWVSDEAGSHHLYWTEPRVIGGSDPVPLGSNNSGRGVGGSMVHYAGYTPRFHPSDFRTFTDDGLGAGWPIGYPDLKPYYRDLEGELPVAGEQWPWGDPHGYPHRPHPVGGNGEVFLRGARALGITAKVGPVAITNGRFGNRPHCIYRGFCLQGCKVNAKASPLITHIPDALAHGAEIRADAMVTRLDVDERTGRATGVHYVRGGVHRFQRAAAVAVAGYSIETPRLLLNSASRRFPDGLCNDFDQVGRYLMVQGAPQTAGRFGAEVRMYKAPPPEVSSEEFYETDPARPYRRGFSIQTVSPLPINWAEHVAAQGHWGSAGPGWPPTSSTAWCGATAAPSRCPISTSPTAACCPPRAAPTRR